MTGHLCHSHAHWADQGASEGPSGSLVRTVYPTSLTHPPSIPPSSLCLCFCLHIHFSFIFHGELGSNQGPVHFSHLPHPEARARPWAANDSGAGQSSSGHRSVTCKRHLWSPVSSLLPLPPCIFHSGTCPSTFLDPSLSEPLHIPSLKFLLVVERD